MKRIVHPNEGHPIPDYYTDGINRAFLDNNNLILTLDSISGIESHDSIYKNEVARLIIPITSAEKFSKEFISAVEQLILARNIQAHPNEEDEPVEVASSKEKEERLGSPFQF